MKAVQGRELQHPGPRLVGLNQCCDFGSLESALGLAWAAGPRTPVVRRFLALVGLLEQFSPFLLIRGVGKKRD